MLLFERQELIKTLNALLPAQFEQIVFSLNVPSGILPASSAPQGERAAVLLSWAEKTGPGLRALQEILNTLLERKLPDSSVICPYKGLSYFDCNDEDYKYFYGRQALTQTLWERVSQDNFLAIIGASGSGKSSVLRAGLLQRLKNEGGYEIRILVPGKHPLQSLISAFVDKKLERTEQAKQLHNIEELIQKGGRGLYHLVGTSDERQVVVVIDQFEESFTLCQDIAERQAFFETLLDGLELAGSHLCLIVAMRSDFLGKCFDHNYGGLAQKVQRHLESVLPMTHEELVQAITEPARQTEIVLEAGLTDILIKDVEQSSGRLPLLQYTLTELWQRRQDNHLKLSVYHQLGGVAGTLEQRANEVYASLSSEQQQIVKYIFLSLTQIGAESEDTRRRVTQASLVSSKYPKEKIDEVTKQLSDAHLVVTDDQGENVQDEYSATVDVAHEALIRYWSTLRAWLEESRELLKQQRRIETAAQEWENKFRQGDYLLQGKPLKEALAFQRNDSGVIELSNLAQVFIQQSIKKRLWSRFKVASPLLFTVLAVYISVEPLLREERIQQAVEQIRNGGNGTRESVEFLVEGCWNHQHFSWLPRSVSDNFLGNCISLDHYDLQQVNLRGTNLRGANLRGSNLFEADLRSADLRNTDLRHADLRNVNFLRSANLSHANLRRADLRGSMLSSANLSNADLRGADLRGADLSNVNLENALLSDARVEDTILGRLTYKTLPVPIRTDEIEKVNTDQYQGGFGYRYIGQGLDLSVPDDLEAPSSSRLILLENNVPLEFPRASHAEIQSIGKGRYSHWDDGDMEYLYFSTSDNSDPRTNGRFYMLGVTDEQ